MGVDTRVRREGAEKSKIFRRSQKDGETKELIVQNQFFRRGLVKEKDFVK